MSDDTRERLSHAARDASAPPNGSDGNRPSMHPGGHPDAEMVSAWLDSPDDFSEQDRLAIERHLAGCAACRQIVAELTAIARTFQTLPLVEPPRSFALTPEVAGLTVTPTLPFSRRLEGPAHPHERELERPSRDMVAPYQHARPFERRMSALRWATAVAALLFMVFVSVDVFGNIDTNGDDDDSAAFTTGARTQPTEMAPMSAAGAQATDQTSNPEAAVQATAASEDTARDSVSEPTATPAAASANESTSDGSDLGPTAASGGSQAEATTAGDVTTMSRTAPTESVQGYAADQESTTSTLSGASAVEEGEESSTLHLIELALVILIAWLIVALIALPRLRRAE